MTTWKISCLLALALAISPSTRAIESFEQLTGAFTGRGELFRELDDGRHRDRIQGTGTMRIRKSGVIIFKGTFPLGNGVRRERLKIKVDKKKGIARVSPAFPIWMENPRTLRGPAALRTRSWTGEVNLAVRLEPPTPRIDTMLLHIDRDRRRLSFSYVVRFKNGDGYDLRFNLRQKN